ncbi:hypothetical protein HD806DRAFT_548968 [Xylariaceae sp. AK1471]|nr:hypothetical protein HD806DRAFT_548968 [Xylariaceae sp. AK1471]
MCVLMYYICSKCYCGYPRFTERCPAMHPPLIYCPRSTRFKFSLVPETECHLRPIHAPLLHLGDDGIDTVVSVHSPMPGPVAEAVTPIPFMGDSAAGRVVETCTAIPTAQLLPSPLIKRSDDVRNDPLYQQCGFNATGVQAQPAVYSGPVNGSSWHQSNFRAPTYNRQESRERAAASSNWRSSDNKGLTPRDHSEALPLYGYYANQSQARTPLNFPYRPYHGIQYQHYPFQAAPMPPFIEGSRDDEEDVEEDDEEVPCPPPGAVYLPFKGPEQGPYYQDGLAPSAFHPHPPAFPHPRPVTANAPGTPRFNHFGWDPIPKPHFNPQAPAFETQAHRTSKLRQELRHENLEQLQRSNAAAYNYNDDYYSLSQRGQRGRSGQRAQSAQNGERVLSSDSTDVGTEAGHSFLDDPHYWALDFPEAGPSVQRGESSCSRARSWSVSSPRRASMSDLPLRAIQENHSEVYQEGFESDVKGKGKEVMRNPPLPWTTMPPPNTPTKAPTPAESCKENACHGSAITSTSASEVGQKSDVHGAPGNMIDQQGKSVWGERLRNVLVTGDTILDHAKAFGFKHLPTSLTWGKETNVSIKHESDDEAEKIQDSARWTPQSIKTDPDDEVKLMDIPLLPTTEQDTLGQASSTDGESDTDAEDWQSAIEPPLVPPNSPALSAAQSADDGILTPESSLDWEIQSSKKGNDDLGLAIEEVEKALDSGLSNGQSLYGRLKSSKSFEILLGKVHSSDSDNKEAPKMPKQDEFNRLASRSKKDTPVTVMAAPKSWSAVVSGRYIPSESLDPFPARAPAYASSFIKTVPTGAPASTARQLLTQPIGISSTTASAPRTPPENPSSEPNVPSSSNVSAKKMNWADEVQEEVDRIVNEHVERLELARSAALEPDYDSTPPPPPNSPVKSYLVPEPTSHLKTPDYFVRNNCRGILISEENMRSLVSASLMNADSASIASDESMAATHSTVDDASTKARRGSPAYSAIDDAASTEAVHGSETYSTVDETESTHSMHSCPRVQSTQCEEPTPPTALADLTEFPPLSQTTKSTQAMGGCPRIQSMPCAERTPPTASAQLTEFPTLSQTKPAAWAPVHIAPELPTKPQKPLWSQILRGPGPARSTAWNPLATVKSKSEGSKDETDWPSLGSASKTDNRRKRNPST